MGRCDGLELMCEQAHRVGLLEVVVWGSGFQSLK